MKYILILVAVLLGLVVVIIYNSYIKCKTYKIKIDEAIDNINILLEKKLELLIDINKKINKNSEYNFLDKINTVKKKNLDNFELDLELKKYYKNFKLDLEDHKDIEITDEIKEHINSINTNEVDLNGVKNYYNELGILYNEYLRKLFVKIIKIIKRYKTVEMFIIEKDVQFEILKKR